MRKIIDSHMHLVWWKKDGCDSIFESLRKYQEQNGIVAVDNMCCSSNGDLWSGFEADQSILGAIVKLENSSVFTHGCLYLPKDHRDFSKFNFKDQLDELMELGLDGIKICDFKPDAYRLFHVGEHLEEYDEFIGYCEKNNVHMCWHVADPKYFWESGDAIYGDGSYPTYGELMDMTFSLVDAHPKLNLLLAHMFFKYHEPEEAVRVLEKYPNVCFDMAPGWGMFAGYKARHDEWSRFFRKYSERILFGTDVSFTRAPGTMTVSTGPMVRFLETDDEFNTRYEIPTRGIKLEGEHLDNILYKNHERTVGKRPKEINKKALKRYIDRYLPFVPDTENRRLIEEYYRKNLI